jgi:hypothetical protein
MSDPSDTDESEFEEQRKKIIKSLEQEVRDSVTRDSGASSEEAGARLHQLEPDNPLGLVSIAMDHYRGFNNRQAMQYIDKALAIDDSCREAVIGKLLFLSSFDCGKDYDPEAEQGIFQLVAEAYPNDVLVMREALGVAIHVYENTALATEFYENLCVIDPDARLMFKELVAVLNAMDSGELSEDEMLAAGDELDQLLAEKLGIDMKPQHSGQVPNLYLVPDSEKPN